MEKIREKLLTVDEYFKAENDFFEKYNKYLDEKIRINQKEHEFIENIEGLFTFSQKADIYLNDEKYKDTVEYFNKKREENEDKYRGGYKSIYNTNFYTKLTEEFIEQRKKEYPLSVDIETMNNLLLELKELKGKYFTVYGNDKKKYKLEFIGVQIDDYYWVGVSDDGDYCWYSAVGKPEFID